MRIPDWIREFFLLPPNKPERAIRRTGFQMDEPPHKKVKPVSEAPASSGAPYRRPTRKELGIIPGKPMLITPGTREIGRLVEAETDEKALPAFWVPLLAELQHDRRIRIDDQCHMGSLRGVDILIEARRAFRRAGIPVKVSLCGQHGFIELR